VLDAAFDPGLVHLHAEGDAPVHGDGERLGAAHPAEAGGQGDRALREPPKRFSATAAKVS
jgi:hypothetical protein